MPINIPSGLYTGGRATFDTSHFTNVILKDQAAKKAAKEAVVKSANDLYKGLNPAGVREQDLKDPSDPSRGLLPKMQNWYNQAKAGNIDYGTYKEMQAEIEQSKQEGKEQLDIGGLVQQNKIELDEKHGDVTKMSEKNLSIYDPRHKPWRQGDLSPFVPEFDPASRNAFMSAAIGKAVPLPDISTSVNKGGYTYITDRFDTETLKQIADKAATFLPGSKKATKYYKNQLTNPEFIATAVDAYQSVYGANAQITTPEEAAKADAIIEARLYEKPRVATDQDLKFLRQKQLVKLRGQYSTQAAPAVVVDLWTPVSTAIDDNMQKGITETPINTLDTRTQDEMVKAVRTLTGNSYIGAGDITVKKDANGEIHLYESGDDKGIWTQQGTAIKQTPGTKGKTKAASTLYKSKPLTVSSYSSSQQAGIKAYMTQNNLSEADAIKELIEAKKL